MILHVFKTFQPNQSNLYYPIVLMLYLSNLSVSTLADVAI